LTISIVANRQMPDGEPSALPLDHPLRQIFEVFKGGYAFLLN